MKLTLTSTIFLMIQAATCCLANAQLTSEQVNRLDQIATQDVPDGAPGIATGIVLGGKVVYSKCAGLEDLTNQSPITAKSRFNIASNGKQFTALAILRLEAKGKLSLKDDIRKYFPEFYSKIDSSITIEHLLTHTSGIRDVYELWAIQGKTWWKFEFGNDDAMELLAKQEDLNFVPGSEHIYSNSNYILLAEIVAKVSGQSFVEFTDDMFQQLGMPDTSFESDHTAIRGPIAKPYFNFQTWKGYDWLADLVGDGCLFSTLEDQLRWECLVQGSGESEFDRMLIEKSQQLVNAELCNSYGYGLEIRNKDQSNARFHAGSTGAWKAYTIRYPQRKLAVVTLSNSGKTIPSMQSRQMVDLFVNADGEANSIQTKPTSIGPKVDQSEILGTYLSGSGFFFEFIQSDDKLLLRRDGRSDVLLERESANVFHEVRDPKFKQAFQKNEAGEMVVTAYHNTHAPYSLARSNNDWTDFEFQSLNGTFVNSETGSEFKLDHVEDKNYHVTIKGKNTRQARLVSANKLVSGSYLLTWTGTLDQNAPLKLNTNRLRNVKFTRVSDDSKTSATK